VISRRYKLVCQACAKEFEDDGLRLDCDAEHEDSLLTTRYAMTRYEPWVDGQGIYRYHNWLPTWRIVAGSRRTVTYHSAELSRITGFSRLWIAFNGYWPEKGAELQTATFKELEAYAVLARLPIRPTKTLVVASAGNTAAAFALACSRTKYPCLIILPETGLARLRFTEPLDPCVKIVTLHGFVDYYDAIVLANQVAQHDGFLAEGGVKNVARRDGLGTTLLNAVETIGQLPDYYFQAIGSGAGGIAVHAMARRLLEDGRFGNHYPRLMLSQNLPFAPMYFSWCAFQRNLIETDRKEGKKQIQQIAASVLSNQRPAYALKGGVFDVLKESQGEMLAAKNSEIAQALDLFRSSEGIDIDPAAGVALATLLKEVRSERIKFDALILLHVTGGGEQHRERAHRLIQAEPALRLYDYELDFCQTIEKIRGLFV
jgi:cysteate synthase